MSDLNIDELMAERRRQSWRRWYNANKERHRERNKRWSDANKEHRSEYNKRYYEENRERIKEQRKRDTAPAPKRTKRITAPKGLPVQTILVKSSYNNN